MSNDQFPNANFGATNSPVPSPQSAPSANYPQQQAQPQGWENTGWQQQPMQPQSQPSQPQGWENTGWQQQPMQGFQGQVGNITNQVLNQPTPNASPSAIGEFIGGLLDFNTSKPLTRNFGKLFILTTYAAFGLYWLLTGIQGLISSLQYGSGWTVTGSLFWLFFGWIFVLIIGGFARMIVEIHRDSQDAREAHKKMAENKNDDAEAEHTD